ncbi:MAG: zinc-dependent metalloprotease [Flavobacteriaceae bacterium]|tara:strand:+ start:57418 stop:59820 length:2403 start_codon:yes stop_codon:yes gene_type:complete
MRAIYTLLLILISTVAFGQLNLEKSHFNKYDGFFPFYHDTTQDKVYLEVAELESEFLYINALSSGIGSNDLGLDRGQLGGERVVFFKKMGNKLMLIQPNLSFRALTDNALEKESVKQAFASSVLFGFPIEIIHNGHYIIDITPFLMQDTHGVAITLLKANQGNFSLDASKSALNLERTRAFPKNIEFDIMLTFKGQAKGEYIRSVTPTPDLVTVAQHHSFVALPDIGFEKRSYDPRSGAYSFSYYDYATPVSSPLEKRYVARHRLEKKDPNAAVSEAVTPIIYYLDNGTPEPVRSALLEGGRWWNQAFEAIGYKDAFQVKILPEDADPLDVRYNVIQWIHRSTRGWSYGSSVSDPRTGEIIKGHVSLGSLRIRQDFMIAQALSNAPFAGDDANHQALLEMSVARIRQLSAHEIGHTLGFMHNFAASTNSKASVMDYPHPQFTLSGSDIIFKNAYEMGIGDWDKVSVAYSYSDFSEAVIDKQEALREILDNATEKGLRYLSDSDARPAGSASIYAHLWDNGSTAAEGLKEVLAVRAKAIENFGIDNIRSGEPLSVLEDVFVPLYFFHRYQTEAAAKVIGGIDYSYQVKGSNQTPVIVASAAVQKEALYELMNTLDAAQIAIPANKLHLFPPRSPAYSSGRESFNGKTGVAFDPLSALETSAEVTLGFLLHPERVSRLIQQKSLDNDQLGLEAVLETLWKATIDRNHSDNYLQQAQLVINFRVLTHLMNLASQERVPPQVTAIAYDFIENKIQRLAKSSLNAYSNEMIRRWLTFKKDPSTFKVIDSPQIPDGSPIGMNCFFN